MIFENCNFKSNSNYPININSQYIINCTFEGGASTTDKILITDFSINENNKIESIKDQYIDYTIQLTPDNANAKQIWFENIDECGITVDYKNHKIKCSKIGNFKLKAKTLDDSQIIKEIDLIVSE